MASPPKKSKENYSQYDQFKNFEGQFYTGMKVGGHHKWHYDAGDWKETKMSPDLWQFNYNVNKRRAGKAPEGSGVPVGTEYHWFILAHQNVRKLDANTYSTAMRGYKYKVAHRRADKENWSTTYKGQRKRLIKFLENTLEHLKAEEEAEKKAPRQRKAKTSVK